MPNTFIDKLHFTLTQESLLPQFGVIVVACSGGADSLALLHGLAALRRSSLRNYENITLHAASLNHGLRGAESAADAAFVAEVSCSLGINCTIGAISDAERAAWKGSVEASARNARYAFLRKTAAETGAFAIALGHTLDDQAETVLMRLLSGAGGDGMAAMRIKSGDLIRPMLRMRRHETEAYCRENGLQYRTDATNFDVAYTRNRIRLELFPVMEAIAPQVKEILARESEIFAADADYLNFAAAQVWNEVHTILSDGSVMLRRKDLQKLPNAMRWRMIRMAAAQIGVVKEDMRFNFDSLKRLDKVVMDASGETRHVQLSTGATAQVTRSEVLFLILPKPPNF